MTEWEGNLGCDETLEDVSDCLKHNHVDDSVNLLLKHIVHHVWVCHHVHGIGCSYFFVEISISCITIIRFTGSHRAFSQEFMIFA